MTDKSALGQRVLEEAISIFGKVTTKIDGLINCSVKDFDILNSHFKQYYNNIQSISEASGRFIDFVLTANNNKLLIDLSDPEKFNIEEIQKRLLQYSGNLKQKHKNLNFNLLILSNLKQDLSTIRLLFTNLRFDPLISTDNQKLNSTLDIIGAQLDIQESKLSNTCTLLNETIAFADEDFLNGIEDLGNQTLKMREILVHLINLSYAARQNKAKLEQLDLKKTSSTSDIITNLQFQDILRQKIEHVQEAHYEITLSLENSHHEGEKLTEEELLKIRDINTLQASQLIHANQEYQRAVETIVQRINELNSLLNSYLNIWHRFCKPECLKFIVANEEICQAKVTGCTNSKTVTRLYNRLLENALKLENAYSATIKAFDGQDGLYKTITELRNTLDDIHNVIPLSIQYDPVAQLKTEIDKLNEGYIKLIGSVKENYDEKNNTDGLSDTTIKPEIELTKNYLGQISSFYNENLFEQINSLKNPPIIDSSLNFSIDQVMYYKTFEKEVKEIISLLDNLLANININKRELNKEGLEHLKELYTMDSERKIHQIVTGSRPGNKEKKDPDSNEVEFF
ncbi:MAG: hypothetical protein JXB34_11525 [Bacteroidales bacterium]|nr:hypothetical protein [Bacteroidales bacterium]